MASIRADVATKVSAEVAETHVASFYRALDSNRSTIASFFVPQSSMPDGKPLPAIVFNGNVIATADAFQKMFVEEMPQTHYDVQSYDCQIINPNYIAAGMATTDGSKGQNITVLVVISGNVRLGNGKESEVKGFSESVVLVPNPEKNLPKSKRKSLKEWLIQSQTFRLVV